MAMQGPGALTTDVLLNIFGRLDCESLLRAGCVCHAWHQALDSLEAEQLWRQRLQTDWGLDQPKTLGDRGACDRARTCYLAWAHQFHWGGDAARNVVRAWLQLEDWLAQHAPDVLDSLNGPASDEELQRLDDALEFSLPVSVRALLKVHNGQPATVQLSEEREVAWHGLFGGCLVYDYQLSTRLLSADEMAGYVTRLKHVAPDELVVACDAMRQKLFYTTNTGLLHVRSADGSTDVDAIPEHLCAGNSAGTADSDPQSDRKPDGLEIWFQEYVRRRVSDEFAKPWWAMPGRRAGPLSLFPSPPSGVAAVGAGPAATRTRCGIQVSISPYFLPEMTRHFDDGGAGSELLFAYQVTFRLLNTAEQEASWDEAEAGPFRPLLSVQLSKRNWVITPSDAAFRPTIVHGDGVVGEFPRLVAGGPVAGYASWAPLPCVQGTMNGWFDFVEGSLARRGPRSIAALCPAVVLSIPDFIY